MNPETIHRLLSFPEAKEFVSFLASQALLLNTLDGIKLDDPDEIALEVKARQRAYETVVHMLEPFLAGDARVTVKSELDGFSVN